MAARYDTLPYRRCGSSGLKLPAISLGLWHNFGFGTSPEAATDLVAAAFDLGITHFDLANNYGPPPGSAEENFGRILDRGLRSHRDEMCVSTKAGFRMWDGPYGDGGSRKYLLSSLDASLARMRLDYVDIFYHHRPDPETPLEETMGALAQAVQSGKAVYAAISNYPADQTKAAAQILADLGVPLLIHQVRYNLAAREAETGGLFDVLQAAGSGAIAFCPLAQGVLTNRYLSGIPADSRAAREGSFLKSDHISGMVVERARALNAIAQTRGQSLAQMALSWTLRSERVTSALIGASRVEQISENVRAVENLEFSSDELAAIDRACEVAPALS